MKKYDTTKMPKPEIKKNVPLPLGLMWHRYSWVMELDIGDYFEIPTKERQKLLQASYRCGFSITTRVLVDNKEMCGIWYQGPYDGHKYPQKNKTQLSPVKKKKK
jgi:hypothetical protein